MFRQLMWKQARTQLFRCGGGVHFELERTLCQQSLKYISMCNTEGEKSEMFLSD